jgi:hypothetical protein
LLTIGPAITGLGFLGFAFPGLTAGPDDYWTTYFPAVILLGIGMGITVAPLTTAVMNSAPAHASGTASGINNAVARTAGVLAIAILGAVALISFSNALKNRVSQLELPDDARIALHAEAAKLGDTAVPTGLAPETAQAVQDAISWSFVDMFRLVAVIAAGLAWLSAALAFVLVGREAVLLSESHVESPVTP